MLFIFDMTESVKFENIMKFELFDPSITIAKINTRTEFFKIILYA